MKKKILEGHVAAFTGNKIKLCPPERSCVVFIKHDDIINRCQKK